MDMQTVCDIAEELELAAARLRQAKTAEEVRGHLVWVENWVHLQWEIVEKEIRGI